MGSDGVLSVEERQRVLAQMIAESRRQAFAAEMNVLVARRLGDDGMQLQAVKQMRRAETAVTVLEKELARLGEAGGEGSE